MIANQEVSNRVVSISPRIALADEDAIFREQMSSMFRRLNCEVREAGCGRDLMHVLSAQEVDCVVLEYRFAAENGLSILAEMKETLRDPPPIVMLSGEKNERTIIKAFRCGISDYVLKDGLKTDELLKAVVDAVDRRSRSLAREAELARLKQRFEFDEATGLHTRAFIDTKLAAVTGRPDGKRCAIALISFDNLESIRDKFGWTIADRALHAFVSRLKAAVGRNDVVGCYDTGRFISITDVDVRSKDVAAACRKLEQALSFDVNLDKVGFSVSASIGAAIYPLDGKTGPEVLAAVERALAQAQIFGGAAVAAAAPAPASGGTTGAVAGPSVPVCRDGDRRAVPRHRVLKPGLIFMANLCSAVSCTIRDISTRGARLRVESHVNTPDRFELVLPSTGERRPVARRWQRGNELGVQFVE